MLDTIYRISGFWLSVNFLSFSGLFTEHLIDFICSATLRVGPDSPFALLSPVLGSEIPFEKGFLENPFSPSRNATFCPVCGPVLCPK